MSACPLVVLACESLHVCTVCIWRCEHARFCVEVFYALYINFHSFIHGTVAKGQMSDDKFKEKMDRYARPKNLKVVVPRVNPVDRSTRGADLKIQNYQKALCTATYALTNIWQTVFTSDSPEIRGLMKGVADSIALIQKTNMICPWTEEGRF